MLESTVKASFYVGALKAAQLQGFDPPTDGELLNLWLSWEAGAGSAFQGMMDDLNGEHSTIISGPPIR